MTTQHADDCAITQHPSCELDCTCGATWRRTALPEDLHERAVLVLDVWENQRMYAAQTACDVIRDLLIELKAAQDVADHNRRVCDHYERELKQARLRTA